jgi:hypothetical protein
MLRDKVPQSEIMDKLGIKTVGQLKSAIADAYMSDGTIPKLVGGRGKAKAAGNVIRVNKRGSLVVSKELVSAFGLKEGEEFTVKLVKSGIKLRRAGAEEEAGAEE